MNQEQKINKKVSQYEPWFDNLVAEIRRHEIQIETDTATTKIKDFYKSIIRGDVSTMMKSTRENSTQYFVQNLVGEFLKEFSQRRTNALEVAISYSDSEVRIWTEINDNDSENEERLFKAEAVVNAMYYQYGFHLSLTIVEKSDNISVPPHFETIFSSGKLSGTPSAGKA